MLTARSWRYCGRGLNEQAPVWLLRGIWSTSTHRPSVEGNATSLVRPRIDLKVASTARGPVACTPTRYCSETGTNRGDVLTWAVSRPIIGVIGVTSFAAPRDMWAAKNRPSTTARRNGKRIGRFYWVAMATLTCRSKWCNWRIGTGTKFRPPGTRDSSVEGLSRTRFPDFVRSTTVGGRVAPGAAAVRLYFHRPKRGKRRRVDALVAQVDGDLQRRLKQPAPFGFFYARVRGVVRFGVVRFGAFRAQALDSSGTVSGTAGGGSS